MGFVSLMASLVCEFFLDPRGIGSIVPSSGFLGRAMSEFVRDVEGRFVVELGGGTGAITVALLEAGIILEELLCVERSLVMVEHLRGRFPGLEVVRGDACDLSELLEGRSGSVNAIVSSLPLRSIPAWMLKRVIDEMGACLEPGGIVIQYTYDLRKNRSKLLGAFKRIDSRMVMSNFPPARVDVFEMK